MKLSKSMSDALENVLWGTHHFGALITGRITTRKSVLRLAALGLVESAGQVAVCDGDGMLVYPERHRQGWRMTALGVEYARNAHLPLADKVVVRT